MNRFLSGLALVSSIVCGAPAFAAGDPAAPAQATPGATTPAAKPAEPLPEAKAIMEKFLAAIGGVERLKQVKSRQVALNMEMPSAGLKGRMQIYQMPPAMAYAETELAQIGKVMQGSDGETVWESSLISGTRILKGAEKAAFLRGMRFNADYDYQDLFKSMTTTGVEAIDKRPAYVVELVTSDDTKETRLFDKESGLLVGMRSTNKSQMGEIASETIFSDYREVGGIKMPFRMAVKAMQIEMITTVEKAELDTPIPAERFALPDEVQALLAKQQAEPPAPATPAPTPTPTTPPAPADKK
ncbi:MAG: DUF620 domain-containing protein [Phycisphaerales bacterium]|nr:DUF620 domain-containing protein [Phycisphaerales bacterium]